MLPKPTQWTAALLLLTLLPISSGIHGPVLPRTIQTGHGLTGSYYISTLATYSDVNPTGHDWLVQVWMDPNDFRLPRPFTSPAAVRVDPQIAFGKAKGFVMQNGRRAAWWPTGFTIQGWEHWQVHDTKPWDPLWFAAAMWKGYVHLPKAGTYYFATISTGPAAVYLGQARVALAGAPYSGIVVSDAFTYRKEDIRDFVQSAAFGREDNVNVSGARADEMYVVPVTIEGPRDLPIEVLDAEGRRADGTGDGQGGGDHGLLRPESRSRTRYDW